jgi:inositol hexakisphosphate/diphosphoinositol-pentakisphosphate kinase
LFRKSKELSSIFDKSMNKIRRDQNYIYEEFLQTEGFDIKVYTVGPDYMYAETRKSPSLDGVVVRTENGKEMRYPVFLTG